MKQLRERWPELVYDAWKPTRQTLHRWMQVVGKVRLSKSPWVNHSWHSTLYVTERGLSTGLIHDDAGNGGEDISFSIELDFMSHLLRIRKSDGCLIEHPLVSESVASFYGKCLGALNDLGIEAKIYGRPNELPDDQPFCEDFSHCSYDPEQAQRFWRVLLSTDRVMKDFRARFIGKVSPVHFFWGSFDLAVTRFSGRRAPEHPGGVSHLPDLVTRDAYSHEVSSCGFWPGDERYPNAAFYSYAYPMAEGFSEATIPTGAYFDEKLREFILPYEVVRKSRAPDALLSEFFARTYEAAAELGFWDRMVLEHSPYLQRLQAAQRRAA